MKIAVILVRFPIITETFILNRITGLIDRGHEVDIFAWTKEKEAAQHGDIQKYNLLKKIHFFGGFQSPPNTAFPYFVGAVLLFFKNFIKAPRELFACLKHLPYNPIFSLRLLYAAVTFLDKGPYDIIHCNYGETGLYFLQLKKILGLKGKLVTSFHGYDVSRFVQKHGVHVYSTLFSEADLFLAVSHSIRTRLIELGCNESKVFVHHSGIDLKRFNSAKRRTRIQSTTRIITIGFTEKKGLDYGIRAIAKLVASGFAIRYSIVGDGPLREKLQSLIHDLDLENVVTLCGFRNQEEVLDLLADADLMIAPSITTPSGDQEGIPNVLKEAMAMGLPVVATKHAGIPELVQDGISGFLVPERDVEALAEKIVFLVKHHEKAIEMGRAGNEFVKQDYDIDTLNDHLVRRYQSLLTS